MIMLRVRSCCQHLCILIQYTFSLNRQTPRLSRCHPGLVAAARACAHLVSGTSPLTARTERTVLDACRTPCSRVPKCLEPRFWFSNRRHRIGRCFPDKLYCRNLIHLCSSQLPKPSVSPCPPPHLTPPTPFRRRSSPQSVCVEDDL